VAYQTTQAQRASPLVHPPLLRSYYRPLTGGVSFFELPEHQWKPWRTIVKKAFSPAHLNSLVPRIVDECVVFRDLLCGKARVN
jgi:cytochrome P450